MNILAQTGHILAFQVQSATHVEKHTKRDGYQ